MTPAALAHLHVAIALSKDTSARGDEPRAAMLGEPYAMCWRRIAERGEALECSTS